MLNLNSDRIIITRVKQQLNSKKCGDA
jgi:hypothetical protein